MDLSNLNKIEYDELLKIMQEQFLSIMEDDYNFYRDFNIILSKEQEFVKPNDREPNSIYIVVKFIQPNFNFGQIVQPVVINALSEQNKIDACQRLLSEYAAKYHYSDIIELGNDLIKQTYTGPSVMSNFNEVGSGYRSLLYMTGTFLIGKNSNPITRIEWKNPTTDENETIPFLTSNWGWSAQLDSQGFYSTKGRTTSETRVGTVVLGFTIYQTNDEFCEKIISLIFDDNESINPDFDFFLRFKNGSSKRITMKCSQVENNQNIGEFPVLSLAFTR